MNKKPFGVGLTILAFGASGYLIGEQVNSVTQQEVVQASRNYAEAAAEYLSIAPDGSCEDTVLSTMKHNNEKNTPKIFELTRRALNDICKTEPVLDHDKLAQTAVDDFKKVVSAMH